jgi:L-ascorbate metabolism protein UlaG (beta-lactamase superfamily)
VTHQHPDHNNVQALKDQTLVVEGPGEYETKGVEILGIQTFHDKKEGNERGLNTVYVIRMDGISICHLGDLGHQLSDSQLEEINGVDILMIPVGGVYTIDAAEAVKVIDSIEPKIVIPMHYKIPGLAAEAAGLHKIDEFCSEMGISKNKVEEKLVIKKKDLPSEETKVVLLKPQG